MDVNTRFCVGYGDMLYVFMGGRKRENENERGSGEGLSRKGPGGTPRGAAPLGILATVVQQAFRKALHRALKL
jgi:hypothetical protein